MDIYRPKSSTEVGALRICDYGASGVGKTDFLGTWPNVFSIADGVEGGFKTYEAMDSARFYDPKFPPIVAAPQGPSKPGIFNLTDLNKTLSWLSANLTKYQIKTIGIDSLTFLADLFETHFRENFKEEITKNKWFLFDKMRITLRKLMIDVHSLGVNVVWLALPTGGDADKVGGPMVAGQTAAKLPATCDVLCYHHVREAKGGRIRELRTQQYARMLAKSRYGSNLADPVAPTYRALVQAVKDVKAGKVPVKVAKVVKLVPKPVVVRR